MHHYEWIRSTLNQHFAGKMLPHRPTHIHIILTNPWFLPGNSATKKNVISGGEWSTGAHHSGFHQTSSGDVEAFRRYLRYGTGAQLAMLEHVGTLVLTGTFLGCRERNQFCNRFGDPCHAWWCPVHQLIPCLAVPHFHALWQHHHWYPAGGWGWEVFCGRAAVMCCW